MPTLPDGVRPLLVVLVATAAALRLAGYLTGDPSWREGSSTVVLLALAVMIATAEPRDPTP